MALLTIFPPYCAIWLTQARLRSFVADSVQNLYSSMGKSGALDGIQGKKLYSIMSAACGAAFMLYGWDAGKSGITLSTSPADHL